VAVDHEAVRVSSAGGLRLEDPVTGGEVGRVGPGVTLSARATGGILRLEMDGYELPVTLAVVRVSPGRVEDPLVIEGTRYRGRAELRAVPGGVSAINELDLEDYLLGVVPLEIGPRTPEELAAVEAQAVAARTYAVARLGGQARLGFDLFGTVEDQAYGGMEVERPEASEAVRKTAGVILMFEGRPIRAYYHSTCGGRTAAIEEVLDRESAPYLVSVSDRAPDGSYYCEASPRFRWNVAWTPRELDSVARPGVAAAFRVSPSEFGPVEQLEVVRRTPSGRVGELAFEGPGADMVLSRLEIRLALPNEGRILNSTDFEVISGADGLVELSGRGYGHGAGMCQWGAIGRARAGQTWEEILTTYYPGAELVNVYEGGDG
jgi:stage II sporulation protein D